MKWEFYQLNWNPKISKFSHESKFSVAYGLILTLLKFYKPESWNFRIKTSILSKWEPFQYTF